MKQVFGLKAEGGYRRSEFVRGVGNETPLLVDHRADAFEETVDRGNKGTQLRGHPLQRQVFEMIGPSSIESHGELRDRQKGLADDDAQGKHQAGKKNRQRQRYAKRTVARDLVTDLG